MPNKNYIFKIAENDNELEQFYKLRSEVFSESQKNPYPNARVASDDLPNSKICIVVNPENNQVIAGVRLNFIKPNENRKITFPERTGFDVYNFLKKQGLNLSNYNHVELGGLVVDKEYRGGNLAGGKVSRILISGSLEAAKDFGAEILFATPSKSSSLASERFLKSNDQDFVNLGDFKILDTVRENYAEDSKSCILVNLSDDIDLSKLKSEIKRMGFSSGENLHLANSFEDILSKVFSKNYSYYTTEIKLKLDNVTPELSFYKTPFNPEIISDFAKKGFDTKISFRFIDENRTDFSKKLSKLLEKFDDNEKQLFTLSIGRKKYWSEVEVFFKSENVDNITKKFLSKNFEELSSKSEISM